MFPAGSNEKCLCLGADAYYGRSGKFVPAWKRRTVLKWGHCATPAHHYNVNHFLFYYADVSTSRTRVYLMVRPNLWFSGDIAVVLTPFFLRNENLGKMVFVLYMNVLWVYLNKELLFAKLNNLITQLTKSKEQMSCYERNLTWYFRQN